jgi:hypothetical protein
MIVLSPEGKAQTSAAKVASLPQFTELRGKVVGLLDNSKPNMPTSWRNALLNCSRKSTASPR